MKKTENNLPPTSIQYKALMDKKCTSFDKKSKKLIKKSPRYPT